MRMLETGSNARYEAWMAMAYLCTLRWGRKVSRLHPLSSAVTHELLAVRALQTYQMGGRRRHAAPKGMLGAEGEGSSGGVAVTRLRSGQNKGIARQLDNHVI